MKKIFIGGAVALIAILLLSPHNPPKPIPHPDQNEGRKPPAVSEKIPHLSRSFHMGFTRWPPDFDEKAINDMYAFMGQRADIIAHHSDSGVPWPEAFDGKAFSSNITKDAEFAIAHTPKNFTVYLALTPLDASREHMAGYRGEKDNMSLPAPWNSYALNASEVKKAYLNYAERMINLYHPDYLAIGIEVNVGMKNAEIWQQYKDLHIATYTELKKKHPALPIFATISLPHLSGLGGANKTTQEKEMREFMKYNDILALSAYPYGFFYADGGPKPVPDDYFDAAFAFGKPVAVAETGEPSITFDAFGKTYRYTEDDQHQYIKLLLEKAQEKKFVFVINWASIDSDKLVEKFPPSARDWGIIFAYTGLEKSNGNQKKALGVWDGFLALPFSR